MCHDFLVPAKAMHLSTGFTSKRKCHLCSGVVPWRVHASETAFLKDWEDPSPHAAWANDPGPSPYKRGRNPMLQLPGLEQRSSILLDVVHIFHLGYGVDLASSTVTLLGKLGFFGNDRAFDGRLQKAYDAFDLWCKSAGRTTSIDEFSTINFKMNKKCLDLS